MQLIHKDKQKRTIRDREEIKFLSFSSFHLVIISARARSEKQISKEATDDEELTVKIDEKVFPKLGSKEALLDSPAAFNGGQLHNLSKTIYFLTFLKGKEHTIVLETDKPPYNTATLENIEIYTLDLEESLKLDINQQAEDGDRWPWITFVLVDLPLTLFRITATVKKRYRDSDDLKIVIDGETKTHFEPEEEKPPPPLPLEWFYRFWYFIGSILLGEVTSYSFKTNLPQGLHYIELHADRMPTVESVEFDFADLSIKLQEIKARVVWDKANLQRNPDTSSQVVLQIPKGSIVIVLEKAVRGERGLAPPYRRQWLSWRDALYNYNSSSAVESYLNEVFSVYEEGVDSEGNILWKKEN